MAGQSAEFWVLTLVVAGSAVLSILYTLACARRHSVAVHDLKARVRALHEEYLNRLAALRQREQAGGTDQPGTGEAAPLTDSPGSAGPEPTAEQPAQRQAA